MATSSPTNTRADYSVSSTIHAPGRLSIQLEPGRLLIDINWFQDADWGRSINLRSMWNPYAEGLGEEHSESPIIKKKSQQPTTVCSRALIAVIIDEQPVAREKTKEWRL